MVAVVDSGINPYHAEFRRPGFDAHPSTYIAGFPKETRALALSFDSPSVDAALRRDAREWAAIPQGEVRWIPGTNIVAAVDWERDDTNETSFFDTFGHGTAVASLAAGNASGPESDGVLLVVVKGTDRGLRWAARQPWIDVINVSWADALPKGLSESSEGATRAATESGKIICAASGNFGVPLILHPSQGPSWNLNVGAAWADSRGERYDTGWPNDVLGLSGAEAATNDSLDGRRAFHGTSAAAPAVCGHIAGVLERLRDKMGETREGARDGVLAEGRSFTGAYLDDGRLERLELEDAIQVTARPPVTATPDPDNPESLPGIPVAGFVRDGFGIVDAESVDDASRVALGRSPRPDRTAEEAWLRLVDALRDAIWKS